MLSQELYIPYVLCLVLILTLPWEVRAQQLWSQRGQGLNSGSLSACKLLHSMFCMRSLPRGEEGPAATSTCQAKHSGMVMCLTFPNVNKRHP